MFLTISCKKDPAQNVKTKPSSSIDQSIDKANKTANKSLIEGKITSDKTVADVSFRNGKSKVKISQDGKKIETLEIDGSIKQLFFDDLNIDKNKELFILANRGKGTIFYTYTIVGDQLLEIFLKRPEQSKKGVNPIYSVKGKQLVEKYSTKDKEGKTVSKSLQYNLVAGEAGYHFKPEGWSTAQLSKMTGQYASRDALKAGYYKVMMLTKNEYGEWIVTIKTKENGTKKVLCDFTGVGHFIDKNLIVPLSYANPDMKGSLKIRFLDLNAIVVTEDIAHNKELTAFCDGRGSIAGTFQKTDI